MSTSDPQNPSGEPDPATESTSPLTTTRGAAARAAAAHAAERPAPMPPPGPDAADVPRVTSEPAVEPVAGRPTYAAPQTHTPGAPADVTPPVGPTTRTDAVTEPVAPRTTGFGGHAWGVLIGLVATPAALVLALVGQGRILAAQSGGSADSWDASLDRWGIALVTAGALVLAVVLYLGVRTAAAPITGGILATAFGAVFLYAPGIARDQTMRWLATTNSHDTVSHAAVAGTSGSVLLVGLLLLTAGAAAAAAKRRGRALGEFRERGRAV